jgi:hypothetical protein
MSMLGFDPPSQSASFPRCSLPFWERQSAQHCWKVELPPSLFSRLADLQNLCQAKVPIRVSFWLFFSLKDCSQQSKDRPSTPGTYTDSRSPCLARKAARTCIPQAFFPSIVVQSQGLDYYLTRSASANFCPSLPAATAISGGSELPSRLLVPNLPFAFGRPL